MISPLPTACDTTYKLLLNYAIHYITLHCISGMSAINPRFASPLKLNDVLCTPYELYVPMCNEELAANSLSHCCNELFDKDSWPQQTVTSPENYVILFFVSLFLLLLRMSLWRFVYQTKKGHSLVASCDIRFWDQYVTMLVAAVYAGLVTNYAKMLIGAPRPAYYAFKMFSYVHAAHRESLNGRLCNV